MIKSNIDKLMELKQLYEQGILTKEEMEVEKVKVINSPIQKAESPNNRIPSIKSLESSSVSTNDENKHNRNNRIILGIATVIVVAIVAVIGFNLNKQTEPKIKDDIELTQVAGDDMNDVITDIEGIDSSTSATVNAKNKVEKLLMNCKWIRHEGGFQYPDSFEYYNEFLIDIPASVDVYTYDSVDICYWGGLGAWSVADEFPSEGIYLSPNETVKNITYQSKGITSGYTNSGKIYYLKQKFYGEDVIHSNVLVLIYPTEYNKSVEKLTKMVEKW